MPGNKSEASMYQVLLERFVSLEANQAKLREDVDRLLQERPRRFEEEETVVAGSDEDTAPPWSKVESGFFFAVSPYKTLLDSLGHAVFVCSASSEEITFWSRPAESLYHWDAEEIVGQRMIDVLVAEKHRHFLRNIMKNVCSGETWHGQFPFQRRSGEQFMALVSTSPMYSDGELVGVVVVSSDAALFNSMHPPDEQQYQSNGRGHGSNFERIRWHLPRPQIAAIPQITSSVSNLALKLLPQRHGDDPNNGSVSSMGRDESTKKATKFEKSVSLADKFLTKMQSKIMGNYDTSIVENGIDKKLSGSSLIDNGENTPKRANSGYSDVNGNGTRDLMKERAILKPGGEYFQCLEHRNQRESLPALPESYTISGFLGPKRSTFNGNIKTDYPSPSPNGIISSQLSLSSKVKKVSDVSSCEIRWEELQLREELGQGSFATVNRGIWNGSDVAVKVYFGGDYNVGTWLDFKKEIDIMKTLRHPNVLLYMGAVYSRERLAIVTEFMPRGSLFNILHHANQQPMDMKRRLKMALDVARGMNYLHNRNPPIVHRDLKSSNLLVDRNWNVKVGDFGLSKWKIATFLSTKSGKGTPQWMAPEVIRNEPSNEKSDIFSFGVVLWELMTVLVPWDHLNSVQVIGVVGFMDRRLDLPEGLNPQIASMIRDCWHSDPAQRPSFEEIIRRMTKLFPRHGLCSRRNSHRDED